MGDLDARMSAAIATLTDDNWHTEAKVITQAADEIARLREERRGLVEAIADYVSDRISSEFKGPWDASDMSEEIPSLIYDAAAAFQHKGQKS